MPVVCLRTAKQVLDGDGDGDRDHREAAVVDVEAWMLVILMAFPLGCYIAVGRGSDPAAAALLLSSVEV